MQSPKILYEDDDCAVVDKPAGILVHPLEGNTDELSIADWWKNYPGVAKDGWLDTNRIGIVHRLDKDTSGVLLLAKTPKALEYFQSQFKKRKVKKIYIALTFGIPRPAEGRVVSNITRDKVSRTHRSSSLINFTDSKAKPAVSLYKTLESFKVKGFDISEVEFNIKTGRTHQIRAHAKMISCPILGDDFYFTKPSRRLSKTLGIARQLLHARKLRFANTDGKMINIECPIPYDINLVSPRTE